MRSSQSLTSRHLLRVGRRGWYAGSLLLTALVFALSLVVCGCAGLTDDPTTDSSDSSVAGEVFEQAEGEIFLEPAGTAGPEAFTGETFVEANPPATLNLPTTTIATTTTAPDTPTTQAAATTTAVAGVQVASVSGDTPALYGGSKSKVLADKEGQLDFFEKNPDKAAAFCAALNADPTFQWSGGNQIQPSQLRDYFEELTPLMLTRDTRVTNHGYRDGKPTPRQSVLQKGQLVLVDQYGVPRVRCECGNPLTPPVAVKKTPVYTGPKWPDFEPATIVVIQPAPVIINIFVVIDIYTGEEFGRPAGTEGAEDEEQMVDVWQLDVSMTNQDDAGHDFSVQWTAAVTLGEADLLSGEGAGGWTVSGPYYEGDAVIGSMTGNGSYNVDLEGEFATTETGDVLIIAPHMSVFSIDDQVWTPPDDSGEAVADFEGLIEEFIGMAFPASIQISPTNNVPVSIDVIADGGWAGTVTITPYEP